MHDVDGSVTPRERRSSVRVLVFTVLVFVSVVVVPQVPFGQIGELSLLRPGDRFGPVGNLITAPVPVGETIVVGMGAVPEESTRVEHATPVVDPQSAPAMVELVACSGPRSFQVGSVRGDDLDPYCEIVRRPEGALIGIDESTNLLVLIRPSRRGRSPSTGSRSPTSGDHSTGRSTRGSGSRSRRADP